MPIVQTRLISLIQSLKYRIKITNYLPCLQEDKLNNPDARHGSQKPALSGLTEAFRKTLPGIVKRYKLMPLSLMSEE